MVVKEFRKRVENTRKRGLKVARESEVMDNSLVDARNDLREQMNIFQPAEDGLEAVTVTHQSRLRAMYYLPTQSFLASSS